MGQGSSSASNRQPLMNEDTNAVTAEIVPRSLGKQSKPTAVCKGPKYMVVRHPEDPLNNSRSTTVIAIDGGGMRGIIPACVLSEVEAALKKTLCKLYKENPELYSKRYQVKDTATGEEVPLTAIPELTESDVHVYLADFIDLVSGTSTGSILAAYIATKGGTAYDNIIGNTSQYGDGITKAKTFIKNLETDKWHPTTKENKGEFDPRLTTELVEGSSTAAQAMFIATGGEIFEGRKVDLLKPRVLLAQLPLVGSTFQSMYTMLFSKYGKTGIETVLQKAFDPDQYTLSDGKSTDRTKLHTSLLIPTYEISHNRPVAFWHFHDRYYPSWGYSTTNRLRPDPQHAFRGIPTTPADANNNSSSSSGTGRSIAPADEGKEAAAQKLWEQQGWMREKDMSGQFPTPYTFGDPARPEVQGRAWYQGDGDTLTVFWADFKLWEVVRASTAAPTYFPAARVTSCGADFSTTSNTSKKILGSNNKEVYVMEGEFADGGVVANNPTLAAIAFGEQVWSVAPKDMAVLSLGCGTYAQDVKVPRGGGQLPWVLNGLVDKVLMGAGVETLGANAEAMFNGAVFSAIAMANAEKTKSWKAVREGDEHPRFVRVQVVGEGSLDTKQLRTQKPNYMAICAEPTPRTFFGRLKKRLLRLLGHESRYSPDALVTALQKMDDSGDWDRLMVIGNALGRQYRPAIEDWVDAWVVGRSVVPPTTDYTVTL